MTQKVLADFDHRMQKIEEAHGFFLMDLASSAWNVKSETLRWIPYNDPERGNPFDIAIGMADSMVFYSDLKKIAAGR
jgi:hypothetical protein